MCPDGTERVFWAFCVVDNNKGCVGITPNISSINVISYINSTDNGKIGDAITFAAHKLSKGEFLILEVQDDDLYPVEVWDREFDAIQIATAAGVIVICLENFGRSPNTPANCRNLSLSIPR